MDRTFRVSATQGRPAGLPLFVLSRNSLNPRVTATAQGLEVKVVFSNRLAWPTITRVDTKSSLLGRTVVAVTSAGWEYLIHFSEVAEAKALLATLVEHGASLTPAAQVHLKG